MSDTFSPASRLRTLQGYRLLARIVLWTAVGMTLAGLDHLIPRPLPWLKLGLANGAAVLALFTLGFRAALAVNLLRVAGVSFLLGTWASPTIVLSAGGAVIAVAGMGLTRKLAGDSFGPVGISALGGWLHMATQFALAAWLFARHGGILVMAGPSLLAAVASGALIGMLAQTILSRIDKQRVISE